MVKRAKFEPIGDLLSPEVAFVQAAAALDVAGMLAQRKEDGEGMANVAALYMELASRLMGGVPDDDDDDEEEVDEEALARKIPLGFCPQVVEDEIIPDEEEIELELEDESTD